MRIPGLLRALVICLPFMAHAAAPPVPPPPKVAAAAWDAAEFGPAEVLVRLREKADLSLAASLPAREDKARFVYLALRATAERSQADLRKWLMAQGVEHRPYIIVNLVWARADRATLLALSFRPEVESILFNPWVKGIEEAANRAPGPSTGQVPGLPEAPSTPLAVEWNVTQIGAPSIWATGFRGEGIVVGDQDTGVRWTHDLIKAAYRGWDAGAGTASHDYNWHDSIHAPATGGVCGPDSIEPCDDHGHGTHTVGTVLGSDVSGNETGVAPGAQWIGCRNMDQGNGTPATYLECFEFFLAPYPVGGDISMGDPLRAPDVTSNSWACPPSEGCAWDILEAAVEAQRAAGIMTVVAAGNSGSSCGSVSDPPALYDAAYTVGASNSSDGMAGFSSRGPSTPNGLTKPDIVAPGVGVRSGTNASDSSFGTWNGTSMATPHVAGSVALVWSARPAYRGHIDETEDLLNASALRLPTIVESCGGDYVDGPNGTWGHGRIDLVAAIAASCPPIEILCDDGFDSDCDGALDCGDSDCDGSPTCFEIDWCADGRDNDQDGASDCDDADCDGPGMGCAEVGRCADARDNDGDTLIDCADNECDGDLSCPESAWCADGRDNDQDGASDCDDTDCDGLGCSEVGRCANARDNDGDTLIDCADDDCDGDAACPESAFCADGRDNDQDGASDCADADCDGLGMGCAEIARCADGRDNDGDTLADCLDDDCLGDAACPESAFCADGRDNDLDGASDCDDADCDGLGCAEVARCADARDNDGDTLADCADVDCVGDVLCDGSDFDGDGRANSSDCLPLDGSVFAAAPEVVRIDVAKNGPLSLVTWASLATASGSGTLYEIAGSSLAALQGAAPYGPACIATAVSGPVFAIWSTSPNEAFLVRAVTPCGPGPAQNWGRDSLGRDRPACP